ncbi:leptin receptor isoform X2 [Cheilinus undulatus]|uniref:leptin receptor isoform X2 n=1 Tax=Cheilinus undulatus TaxID=241271 RepID=UPI001BD44B9D|nr:leptin receptor isoform X2 [Cheilinus undulatus]
MTTTMAGPVMFTVLILVDLLSHGVQCLGSDEGSSLRSGVLDLPWQDELCCDSTAAHLNVEEGDTHAPETNRSESNFPRDHRCNFRSLSSGTQPHEPSAGTCFDVLCRIEHWENLTCDLQSHGPPSTTVELSLMAVSLQHLLSEKDGKTASNNNVVCTAEDSFTCSLAIDATTSFVAMLSASISGTVAPSVLLRIPARPVKPSPPVNLSHTQTIEAELILHWEDPSDFVTGPLRYEVRYSSSTHHPTWKVLSVPGEPWLSLDLKPRLNYSIQVRCSSLNIPPLWSNWSEPHYIYLDTVSYIPEKVVVKPGENVTIYCVFNDHNINASMAVWILNFDQQLHHSHPVNQWVSQITVRPSESRLYDLLQCTHGLPYSQIFVEGASIDIKCETDDGMDTMDCSWDNKQWTNPTFRSSWADLPCDVMEEKERAGETVGELGPQCKRPKEKTCTIHPLRMNCYKLWLEVPSRLGPIRSKPVYLSPIYHVKPLPPTNVKAVSRSSRILTVTWESPLLPSDGVQCQFRYHLLSAVREQLEWQTQDPVPVSWAEATVADMCRVYVVEVSCIHISGEGYWSKWSEPVYSTPENSKAPDHGPNFWRILQDDPYRNQTNVTLLFEPLQISDLSYCVEGFIVQQQTMSGSVIRAKINVASSYSFKWDQSLQTVTVEAYNSMGSSTNNFNMTLERQPKRRCVRSFTALVINSTCVILSWTLLENSSAPLFMVVQWSPQGQQDPDHKDQSWETWARLPYTEHPVYLGGDFFDSEESAFYLYPVFADGEGEPVYAAASRGDPAAYMLLMIISFLSIVLFVTLVLSQNQMKKFVWKDVPNPSKCSWAKGLDLKKVDSFNHLFRPPECLTAWPLLLPSENISKVVILDKVDISGLTTLVQAPRVSLTADSITPYASSPTRFHSEVNQAHTTKSDLVLENTPAFVVSIDDLSSSNPQTDQIQLTDHPPGSTDSSAQSSVVYATVLLSDPRQDHLNCKDSSGSSSSDEGNFSANNSDISGSFHGALWELDDPRRSCSYNSVEELSETSEQEDEDTVREEKDLYYLGMDYPAEDEDSEDDEEQREGAKIELLKSVVLSREDSLLESHPLLGTEDSSNLSEPLSSPACDFSLLYLPQFRTASSTRQQDGTSSTAPAEIVTQTAFK